MSTALAKRDDQLEVFLRKVPEEQREELRLQFVKDPTGFASKLAYELDRRKKFFPTKDFIPNIGQERALLPYKRRHETYGDYPNVMIFTGANGVGKTCSMAILIAGASLGTDFLNREYFDYDYFRDCEKLRRERVLKIRIVCNKADVEDNGSVTQEIKRWIPMAEFSGKTSGGYYTNILIPAVQEGFHPTIIDIKTHDQDVVAHAGPNYDLVLFNEPAPGNIFAENVGRIRCGGRIACFLTPLNSAAYLHKIINSEYPDGEVVHVRASIWDNCKDREGTRGHLSEQKILAMIRNWQATNPLEVEARSEGKFMFLSGAVFPVWNNEVHVIPPMPINSKWKLHFCIDPHPKKPSIGVWLAQGPMGYWYVIAEWPTAPWDEIQSTSLTIRQMCDEYLRVERGQNERFRFGHALRGVDDHRYGDPNGMKAQNPQNRTIVKQEYEAWLPGTINVNIDNDIALRHDKIRELLGYDFQRPVDAVNSPKLYVFSWCKNVIRAFGGYRYLEKQGMGLGESDKLDQVWKDWIDPIGYILVTAEPWSEPRAGETAYDAYEEIDEGRSGASEYYAESYGGQRWI